MTLYLKIDLDEKLGEMIAKKRKKNIIRILFMKWFFIKREKRMEKKREGEKKMRILKRE